MNRQLTKIILLLVYTLNSVFGSDLPLQGIVSPELISRYSQVYAKSYFTLVQALSSNLKVEDISAIPTKVDMEVVQDSMAVLGTPFLIYFFSVSSASLDEKSLLIGGWVTGIMAGVGTLISIFSWNKNEVRKEYINRLPIELKRNHDFKKAINLIMYVYSIPSEHYQVLENTIVNLIVSPLIEDRIIPDMNLPRILFSIGLIEESVYNASQTLIADKNINNLITPNTLTPYQMKSDLSKLKEILTSIQDEIGLESKKNFKELIQQSVSEISNLEELLIQMKTE